MRYQLVMTRIRTLSLVALLLIAGGGLPSQGCHPTPTPSPTPTPTPTPPTPQSGCDEMCKHIGPVTAGGLGCEEGNPVYDSDVPGPAGVPNVTCVAFCEKQQENGVSLNTSCVSKVKSCDEIESARQHCGQ